MSDISIIVSISMAIIGALFAVYKWVVHRADKRHEAHDRKFQEHANRFVTHETRIAENEQLIGKTRDEMHRDYVREDHIDKIMHKLSGEIGQLHHRLGGLAKDLNQAIGSIKTASDAEMKAVVKEIKDALQHREN